jgi:hypothetical protein
MDPDLAGALQRSAARTSNPTLNAALRSRIKAAEDFPEGSAAAAAAAGSPGAVANGILGFLF